MTNKSNYDSSGVLKHVHSQDTASLRVVDVNNVVGDVYTRVEVDNENDVSTATFWYDKNFSEFTIRVSGDIDGQLAGKYFTIDIAPNSRSKVGVYFTIDGQGIKPDLEDYTFYEIPLNENDLPSMVSFAVRYVLNTIEGLSASSDGDLVRLTNTEEGISSVDKGNTLFNFETVNLGKEFLLKEVNFPKVEGMKYIYNSFDKKIMLTNDGFNLKASGKEITSTETDNFTGLDIVVKDVDLEYNQFAPPKEADFVDIDKTLEKVDTIYYKKGGIQGEVIKIVRLTYVNSSKQAVTRMEIL